MYMTVTDCQRSQYTQ